MVVVVMMMVTDGGGCDDGDQRVKGTGAILVCWLLSCPDRVFHELNLSMTKGLLISDISTTMCVI